MNIKFNASGEMETIINGNVINQSSFNTNYDGKKMKISGYNDGVRYYEELSNKDIGDILSRPSHKLSLEERFKKDFKINKTISKKGSKKNRNKTRKR